MLGLLLASGSASAPLERAGFEPRPETSCKPVAPLQLELGAPRVRADGAIELDYGVRALVDGELLEPRVSLGPGWTLVAHEWDAASGAAPRAGRVVLRGDGRAASLELVARLALPEPEASGGVIVHERVFAFGAPAPRAFEGVRTVRSAEQVSRDVPAIVR